MFILLDWDPTCHLFSYVLLMLAFRCAVQPSLSIQRGTVSLRYISKRAFYSGGRASAITCLSFILCDLNLEWVGSNTIRICTAIMYDSSLKFWQALGRHYPVYSYASLSFKISLNTLQDFQKDKSYLNETSMYQPAYCKEYSEYSTFLGGWGAGSELYLLH